MPFTADFIEMYYSRLAQIVASEPEDFCKMPTAHCSFPAETAECRRVLVSSF
jgi:hypothetical protein